MQALILAKQSFLVAAVALLVWGVSSDRAEACSCGPSTVERSHYFKSDVVLAEIRFELSVNGTRYYFARVRDTYKGCLVPEDWVVLTTPESEAACGITFVAGEHLINGDRNGTFYGLPTLSIHSCDYNVAEAELTEHDRAFLNGRYVCCGADCACADGSQPVQCLMDPCQAAPACRAGQCTANYCGGCNAEFYAESGYAVCQGDVECLRSTDCPVDQWCRQAVSRGTATMRTECVPYVGEGATCDGWLAPYLIEHCEAGLVCDTPDTIAEASGICRRP